MTRVMMVALVCAVAAAAPVISYRLDPARAPAFCPAPASRVVLAMHYHGRVYPAWYIAQPRIVRV